MASLPENLDEVELAEVARVFCLNVAESDDGHDFLQCVEVNLAHLELRFGLGLRSGL